MQSESGVTAKSQGMALVFTVHHIVPYTYFDSTHTCCVRLEKGLYSIWVKVLIPIIFVFSSASMKKHISFLSDVG